MTKTHTPGPWHVTSWPGDADVPDGCSIGIDDEFGADGGRNYYLATVVHSDPVELEANARLIAAAPDLLSALRALADAVDRFAPTPEDWPELAVARAALARATE